MLKEKSQMHDKLMLEQRVAIKLLPLNLLQRYFILRTMPSAVAAKVRQQLKYLARFKGLPIDQWLAEIESNVKEINVDEKSEAPLLDEKFSIEFNQQLTKVLASEKRTSLKLAINDLVGSER